MKTIAVDIDDVLSSQVDVLIQFSNSRYGTSLTRDDFQTPGEYWGYFEMLWGVGDEEGKKRFKEFLDEKIPLTQVIEQEALRALQALKKNFRLDIVTSRHANYHQDTLEWLERQVPGIFDGVHFVALWDEKNGAVTKAAICREIGAGYLIDDNADHCNLAAEAGIQALLFGQWGWNVGKSLHENVTPIKNWTEVIEYFYGKDE